MFNCTLKMFLWYVNYLYHKWILSYVNYILIKLFFKKEVPPRVSIILRIIIFSWLTKLHMMWPYPQLWPHPLPFFFPLCPSHSGLLSFLWICHVWSDLRAFAFLFPSHSYPSLTFRCEHLRVAFPDHSIQNTHLLTSPTYFHSLHCLMPTWYFSCRL